MIILKKMLKFCKLFFLLFIISHIFLYIYCKITPKIEITKSQTYYLYDKDNKLLFRNNDWINIENINKNIINATIYTEDKNFYHHIGFDYFRIVKALFKNIVTNSKSEGASTITQQYARNLFLNFDKTWSRKIHEAIIAFKLEISYSKNEIIEGYLNTINYGGVFGIENAAQYYFNKSASDLNLSEAAILAGIPQSPNNNSPFKNIKNAKNRQKTVLNLLKKNKIINIREFNNAIEQELIFSKNINKINKSSYYFRDAVLNELKELKIISNSISKMNGLKIYTTLDSNAQNNMIKNINKHMPKSNLEIASIMINPSNGEVIALSGGRDYEKSQFNRAIQAKRQVGSTMKPLLYYSALENGLTSSSTFTSEITSFNILNNKPYNPKNYNNIYANNPITMGAAIAYSDNIFAVKTHLFLGENNLVNIANRLGIKQNLAPVPSLALGTEEITLLEMINAYSIFANNGNKSKIHFIKKIEDKSGNILYNHKNIQDNILNPSLTFILNNMLTYTYDKDFIDYNYPTIINLLPQITKKYAIKTGTTDNDLWIIGYNKNALLGIWNGYDNNSKLRDQDKGFHKKIWIDTMENYLKNKKNNWYNMPNNVVGIFVNPITGEIVKETDKKKKLFYYLKGTEPILNNKNKSLEEVFQESNNLTKN